MSTALSVLLDATLITLVLALASFGLAIIFGLIGVINMGHGAMLTLGAYFTWACMETGIPFVPAALLAALGVGLLGLALEHFVIRYFYDRPFDTLLLTWGFFLITTEIIKIVFGTDFRSVANPLRGGWDLGVIEIPIYRGAVAAFSLLVILATGLVLFRTGLGIKIRALIQNREMASLLGLNIGLTYKLVFAFGAFMAGLAGALLTPMMSIDPYIGNIYLVRAFFAVTVGGIGQILGGTLIGSFLIGGTETVFALFSSQALAQTIVFALAILVLRFRPAGVLAQR
jgi:branched-subunit amino acid ABC-type transport system permease component